MRNFNTEWERVNDEIVDRHSFDRLYGASSNRKPKRTIEIMEKGLAYLMCTFAGSMCTGVFGREMIPMGMLLTQHSYQKRNEIKEYYRNKER